MRILGKVKINKRARERSRLIWQHNSFLGHAEMTQKNMISIINSCSASEDAKEKALEIQVLAGELRKLLEQRNDEALETYIRGFPA